MSELESSSSYGEKKCCGAECPYLGMGYGTCWGDVTVVDEDSCGDDHYWVHACEGHADMRDGGKYVPEQKPLDTPDQVG